MYRTCLFCSRGLGGNEALPAFPVGRALAFDAARGRLWAVCPACRRWNLAPIDERWEAVEGAERLFRDTRLRVQRENVGLCRLADGTRLVRVGEAVPGELAAWRYGGRLVRRRRRLVLGAAAAAAVGIAGVAGLVPSLAALGAGVTGWGAWALWDLRRFLPRWPREGSVVHRVPAAASPAGAEVLVRHRHLRAAYLTRDLGTGAPMLHVPGAELVASISGRATGMRAAGSIHLMLRGGDAERVLGRAMVRRNRRGAPPAWVRAAVDRLADAGSAAAFLAGVARSGAAVGAAWAGTHRALPDEDALALEMALHEETERRALHGELALLRAAWREAEEIAAIADGLAGEPSHVLPPAREPSRGSADVP
jgi:hypothetical protein